MAALETAFIINFILNIAIAVTGIIVSMLIPSSRKIRDGEAGTSMGTVWILLILIIMVLVSIIVLPLTIIFLEGNNLYFGLALDAIAIIVTILAIREFFSARKAYKEMDGVEVVAVQPQHHQPVQHPVNAPAEPHHPVHQHQEQPHQEVHDHQPGNMTVECPSCGNHIQIAEGSNTITCPYCGLAGTL